MAAKIYSNAGVSMQADTGGDVASEIMSWMQQAQANKRADSQLLMQEAEHKWRMDTERRTLNSVNALQTYSGEGYDWEGLSGGNMGAIFGKSLPDFNEGFKKYEEAQLSNGASANVSVFMDARKANDQRYMNVIKGKFNALRETVKNNNPNSDDADINRYMNKYYNADKVYANYISAFDVNDPLTGLQYQPTDRSTGILANIGSMFYKPSVKGEAGETGGGIAPLPSIAMGASPLAAGYGAYKGVKQYKAASADYLAQAEKDWGKYKQNKTKILKGKKKGQFKYSPAEGSGLDAKAFKKKYGTTKKAFGGEKVFKASEEAMKKARSTGFKGTWASKTGSYLSEKGKALGAAAPESAKNILSKAKGMAKTGAWYGGANIAGGALGDLVGGLAGEKSGRVGREIGELSAAVGTPGLRTMYSNISKKISEKGIKWALDKIMKKGGVKLAAKLAAKGALGSIGGAMSGGVATGVAVAWAAKDVYDIARILSED